jgi:hypothetical protein
LVFSAFIDQQPVVDVEDNDPTVVHGPPLPTAGVNPVGAASDGAGKAGVGVIEERAPDPAERGIGLVGIGLSGIGLSGTGLSPLPLVSTEPKGIPVVVRPSGNVVGIADDDAVLTVPLVSHVDGAGVLLGNGIPIATPPPS